MSQQQSTQAQRILVTGGSSYLGRHLVPLAGPRLDVHYTYYSDRPTWAMAVGHQLDLRDKTAVLHMLQSLRPTTIIHLAGSNRTPDMTAVIVEGTGHITAAAKMLSARLIHLSTDVIFDGTQAPYDETAVATPLNAYGQAKAQAEQIVQTHANSVIIRTSLIYGLQHMDHGTNWIATALRAGQPVTLFNNQYRNPIWANSLSQACIELIDHAYTGILNVAGQQRLSRAEFALRLLDWWDIPERQPITIGPTTSDQWPLDCTLDLRRATAVLQTPLPGVDDVLQQHKQ